MTQIADSFRDWDAAYVLGALSTTDRRAFELHFASCQNCATAVADLAGIPGFLTKIDVDTAVALAEAPDDKSKDESSYNIRQLAIAANNRRRRMRRKVTAGLVVAASFLIVLSVFMGRATHPANQLASSTNVHSGIAVAMTQLHPNGITADLRVTSKPWGTRFDWSCNYGSAWEPEYGPRTYDLVLTDASGVETTIATWNASGNGATGLSASVNIPIAKIRTVEIRAAGTDLPLVQGQL